MEKSKSRYNVVRKERQMTLADLGTTSLYQLLRYSDGYLRVIVSCSSTGLRSICCCHLVAERRRRESCRPG